MYYLILPITNTKYTCAPLLKLPTYAPDSSNAYTCFVSIKFDLGNVESDEYELSLTKHNWTQPRRYDI